MTFRETTKVFFTFLLWGTLTGMALLGAVFVIVLSLPVQP
jgi:hypothetical protein